METKNIIAGLQTLMPFYKDPDGYHVGAEHDELCAYATDNPLSDEALDKMIELGWHQEHDELDNDEDFSRKDYRHDEGWICYT